MMNESNNEQLSAFIDGEHEDAHVLDNLIHNQNMKNTWSRYHLIGDCLRDNLPEEVSNHVSTRVTNALRDEPTVLAPKTTKQLNIKPLVGFAIAASVAMVAVFSIKSGNEQDSSFKSAPTIAATTVAQPQIYSFPGPQVLPAAIKRSDTPDSVANQRLNNYLINHNEYRSSGGVNAILPYVRIVTTEPLE
jgi:sigma-E factor negative regulatory protein RseA